MKSLALRLVVTYVALIVAMTTVAGIGILGLTKKYFVDAERQSILVQARVVARSCDDVCVDSGNGQFTLTEGNLPAASNIARNQQNAPSDYSVGQVDPSAQQNLQALVPSNILIFTASADRSTLTAPVKLALAGREATTTSQKAVVAVVPIRRNGKVVAAVQASGTLANVQAVLDDVRRQVLIALIASAVLASLIGVWRARSIAKPIRELTVAANQLSAGNFDAPLPPARSADELGELTKSFDVLRSAVKSELRARSAFVGDASHELRTPLTAMRGAVEILRSEAGARPEVRQRFLMSLDTEMNRLLKLVEDLLTLNSSDHQARRSNWEPIHIEQLVGEVMTDLQPLALQRNIELVFERATDGSAKVVSPVVLGDQASLRQLLINVVDNAMVHAPDGKTIDVTVGAVGIEQGLVIEVRDRGPGLEAADRLRVFDRFTRLDAARTRNSGGAGLGLSIARVIARDHGGDVTFVDPLDGGPGIAVRICLPLSATRLQQNLFFRVS